MSNSHLYDDNLRAFIEDEENYLKQEITNITLMSKAQAPSSSRIKVIPRQKFSNGWSDWFRDLPYRLLGWEIPQDDIEDRDVFIASEREEMMKEEEEQLAYLPKEIQDVKRNQRN